MITFTMGDGRRVTCLGCGEKFSQSDFSIDLRRGASWRSVSYRISMFCRACRRKGLEERLAAQQLVNTDS